MNMEEFMQQWSKEPLPYIAILRGIHPEQAAEAAKILLECGFRYLEVPLNSPSPFLSIQRMRDVIGDRGYVGAGTVLTTQQVDQVVDSGGQLIISPNCDPAVIRYTRQLGLISVPGVATPSEAFSAIANGASALKLFPAEMINISVIKAFRAVLPSEIQCLPVGGIQPDAMQLKRYMQAGANGFGLGSGLFRAGMTLAQLKEYAIAYRLAFFEIRGEK